MTGIYVRMRRDDAWVAVEVEQLTDLEWALLERQRPLDGWRWAKATAEWIRENVRAVAEETV